MTQLSATYPANQWAAHLFHKGVELAVKDLMVCAGSTNAEISRDIVLKGLMMHLPAGNA